MYLLIGPDELQQLLVTNSLTVLDEFGVKIKKFDEEDARILVAISRCHVQNIFKVME